WGPDLARRRSRQARDQIGVVGALAFTAKALARDKTFGRTDPNVYSRGALLARPHGRGDRARPTKPKEDRDGRDSHGDKPLELARRAGRTLGGARESSAPARERAGACAPHPHPSRSEHAGTHPSLAKHRVRAERLAPRPPRRGRQRQARYSSRWARGRSALTMIGFRTVE